jgi:hypothetical protein
VREGIAPLLFHLQTGAMFEGTVLHDVPEGDQHEEQEEDADQAGPSLEEQIQMAGQASEHGLAYLSMSWSTCFYDSNRCCWSVQTDQPAFRPGLSLGLPKCGSKHKM